MTVQTAQISVRVLFPRDFPQEHLREGDQTIPLEEMLMENDNPANLSDQTMRLRVARFYDISEDALRNFQVTRPTDTSILVAPKTTFG